MNLGQLIIDQGGWDDPKAIEGSIELVASNTSMGKSWVGKDAQTKRTPYFRVEQFYQEEFEESWSDFQTFIEDKVQNVETVEEKRILFNLCLKVN